MIGVACDYFAGRHNVSAGPYDLGERSDQPALVLEGSDVRQSIAEITALIAVRREIVIAAVDCGTDRLKSDCQGAAAVVLQSRRIELWIGVPFVSRAV